MATPLATPIRTTGSATATPTRIPRARARAAATIAYSPPAETLDDEPGTPGPTKARINSLTGQVQELVRKQHSMERKHNAEILTLQRRLEERDQQILQMKIDLSEGNKRAARAENELKRTKSDGEGMREELNLFSLVQQQKALLAMSEEKLQVLELEQRLVQTEISRVMRDHKISLFVSREADLVAEVAQKQWRIEELEEELESANTSLAHQRAAENKAKALATGETRSEITALEGKLAALEAKLAAAEAQNAELVAQSEKERARRDKERAQRENTEVEKDGQVTELQEKLAKAIEKRRALKEKYAEAAAKIEELQSSTGGEDQSEVVTELRAQLRAAKSEAAKKADEAADAAAELELSREREKTLKAKFQDAHKEQLRLAGVEEELAALKAAGVSKPRKKTTASTEVDGESPAPKKRGRPKKTASATASPAKEKPASKSRVRKTSPVDSGDEAEAEPKPKSKRSKKDKTETETAPLAESSVDNIKAASDDETVPEPAAAPEKKKKRRLLGAQAPAFKWDPVMNSGDGVIPLSLSPINSARSTATIPRAGFSSLRRQLF